MNAVTLTHASAPSLTGSNDRWPAPVQQMSRNTCPSRSDHELRKKLDDRAFEAGVRWFLAVSRAA